MLQIVEAKNIKDNIFDGILSLTPKNLDTIGDDFVSELHYNLALSRKLFALYSGRRLDASDQVDLVYYDKPEFHLGYYDEEVVYKSAFNSNG